MKNFNEVNVLVVGDIMLDRYICGTVSRISPEAPVPIVLVHEEYSTLGGSGNVVRNIRSLGAKVTCLASIALDNAGHLISQYLRDIGAETKLVTASHVSIVKERIVAGERKTQMLRVDREIPLSIDQNRLINAIRNDPTNFDVVVVSDYQKGLIGSELMEYLRNRYETIIIDPKPGNVYNYGKVFLMTPNEKEWNTMICNSPFKPEADYFLVTKGKKGMELIDARDPDRNNWAITDIPSHPVEVFNPSGAGDTALAVLAVCYAAGLNLLESSIIANDCAGWVVTQPGTTAIEINEFNRILIERGFKIG